MANTARLVIDPIARKISTKYEKIRLVQNDNNSTRVTFEMPRYVRGHDMSRCSTVEVHYDNISIDRKQVYSDVYFVSDIIVAPEDEETINFSWLVDRNATQVVGTVEFSLHFGCNEDPALEYAWHTTTYSGIVVLAGKHNTESAVERTPSIFESFKNLVNERISEATNIIAEVKEIVDNINDQIYGDGDIPEDAQSGSLAYRVSELENGKFDKSSIAQTLDGFTEEEAKSKAPSVKAVKAGLDKKVNALSADTSAGTRAIVFYGNGSQGNLGVDNVNRPTKIPAYTTNEVYGDNNQGGFLTTAPPTKKYHCANKIYVDGTHLALSMDETFNLKVTLLNANDEEIDSQSIDISALVSGLATKTDLAGKVDTASKAYVLYGTDANGNQAQLFYGNNVESNRIVQRYHSGNIQVPLVPNADYVATSKAYVDGKVDPITSQLGSYIKTDMRYGDRTLGGFPVPDNAYPTVYLSDPSFTAINADGETAYVGRATKLIFIGNGNVVLGTEYIEDYTNPSCFVTLPEGTKTIALNIEELATGWDSTTLHYWGYALFQVKGGA